MLLPVCASWWEEVTPEAEAEATGRASDDQLRQWRVQAEVLYERELGAFASRQEKTHGALILTLTLPLTRTLLLATPLTLAGEDARRGPPDGAAAAAERHVEPPLTLIPSPKP